MPEVLASPIVKGALAGLLGAAAVDFSAFRSWRTLDSALKYDWKVAGWRWLQGAVVGAVGATGYGAVVG